MISHKMRNTVSFLVFWTLKLTAIRESRHAYAVMTFGQHHGRALPAGPTPFTSSLPLQFVKKLSPGLVLWLRNDYQGANLGGTIVIPLLVVFRLGFTAALQDVLGALRSPQVLGGGREVSGYYGLRAHHAYTPSLPGAHSAAV